MIASQDKLNWIAANLKHSAEIDARIECSQMDHSMLNKRIRIRQGKLMAMEIENERHLPEDTVIEVLSWLPVKALLRFKSVSKSWYAIIKSPLFISMHLKNYNDKKSHRNDRFLANSCFHKCVVKATEFLVDKFRGILSYNEMCDIPQHNSFICGPCDGLYYLWGFDSYNKRALWNPATREFRALPHILSKPNLPFHLKPIESELYGFGWDPITKDYKVVVMKSYVDKVRGPIADDRLSVFIYSLRTNSWRHWGELTKCYKFDSKVNRCYAFVNTSFHWLAYEKEVELNTRVIISFDLAAETFKEIQVPNYSTPALTRLGVYNGLIVLYVVHQIDKYFDIWTLDYSGLWTKKFTLGSLQEAYLPVGHWKDNMFILEKRDYAITEQLLLCDPSVPEMRDLGFCSNIEYCCEGVFAYMESLVSIKI